MMLPMMGDGGAVNPARPEILMRQDLARRCRGEFSAGVRVVVIVAVGNGPHLAVC